MDIPLLTPEQIEFFHREGYVLPIKVLDDATLQALRQEEERFRHGPNPLSGTFDVAGATSLFRSQVTNYSAPVREFGTRGPHLPLMQQLIARDICLWFTQFVTKLPDGDASRGEFPWHQDNGYIPVEPATNVTIWIALDDVNEENGCVYVQPQSHKLGLLDHKKKSEDSWHLKVTVEGEGVPAILRAGEAVVFTGLTLHRSKFNRTDKPRRALFLEYADLRGTIGVGGASVVQMPHVYVLSGAAPLATTE